MLQCCPLRDSPSTPVLGLMAEISSCGARPCTAVFGLYLVCAISECTRTLRQAPAKCNNSVCCLGGLIIATAVAVPWLRPSVSRRPAGRPLTAETRVWSRISPCKFCGGQSVTVTGMPPALRFSLSVCTIPPVLRTHSSSTLFILRVGWVHTCNVTARRDSVDGTRDRVTYQKLVTR